MTRNDQVDGGQTSMVKIAAKHTARIARSRP
jgi:hypothetical protein